MTEQTNIEEIMDRAEEAIEEKKQSFPDKVWRTFRLLNIEDQVAQKKIEYENKQGQRKSFTLDYISWTTAWYNLMECFPESKVKFHDPLFFANGTGEQWVTVTVIDGEKRMKRKWFLPYLNQKNAPVTDPNSLQINNTRMRCFTKVMALCGLGIEVYGGEDIPNESHDQETVPGVMPSVRKIVLEDLDFDEAACQDWIEKFNEIMPSRDSIDYDALTKAYHEFGKLGDLTVAIYDGLNSWQRAEIGKIRRDVQEQKRLEAVAKIQSDETSTKSS